MMPYRGAILTPLSSESALLARADLAGVGADVVVDVPGEVTGMVVVLNEGHASALGVTMILGSEAEDLISLPAGLILVHPNHVADT